MRMTFPPPTVATERLDSQAILGWYSTSQRGSVEGLHLKYKKRKDTDSHLNGICIIHSWLLFLLSVDAGGARGSVHQFRTAAALEHDLTVVLDLLDVGSVVVESHVAHQ